MSVWQLQEAKNKFSQLVQEAVLKGPQVVTKRGVETVVVVSLKKYSELIKPQKTLAEILMNAPKAKIDITRNKEAIREIEF